MKSRTFRGYADPGHAWVKVSKQFLMELCGPHWRSAFTQFSYENNGWVYLEEDVDALRFVKWCNQNGIEPIIKVNHTNNRSRIRNYQPLQSM